MARHGLTQTDDIVHVVRFEDTPKVGWSRKFLLLSDVHLDSMKCDRDLLKRHLKKAKEDNAQVMIFGDLFDAMQGRNDRRGNKLSIDPEIYKIMMENKMDYYDAAVKFVADFLMPYKDQMMFMSYGNHETAINRHNETDILRRVANQLDATVGAYEGYVKFIFPNASKKATQLLKYHHGYGGAKRSKGMLDSQLFAFLYPSADICVRGHNHYKFHDTNGREFVTERGKAYRKKQLYVNLGTYKKKDPGHGWETEKGFYPPVLGGWWMEIRHHTPTNRKSFVNCTKIRLFEAD